MRLAGKMCLITGGAAGIDRATAERFAEEGASVVICDVSRDSGSAAAKELGPSVAFYAVDVTDRQAVQAWVDKVVSEYDRIDVLVNNAGVLRDAILVKVKNGALVRQMLERWPLLRPGQPRDVAHAYLFLASDEASFIPGAVLRVDGGSVIGT